MPGLKSSLNLKKKKWARNKVDKTEKVKYVPTSENRRKSRQVESSRNLPVFTQTPDVLCAMPMYCLLEIP